MNGRICTLGLVVVIPSLVSLVFAAALVPPEPAYARASESSADVVVVTSRLPGGSKDVFWVIDTPAERLLVYELINDRLTLGAARDIHWDLLIESEISRTGSQTPAVSKVKKDTTNVGAPAEVGARKIIAVPGKAKADERDYLYLLDTRTLRQVIYEYNMGKLRIVAARNIRYDLKLDEYPRGGHDPTVEAVREEVERKRSP